MFLILIRFRNNTNHDQDNWRGMCRFLPTMLKNTKRIRIRDRYVFSWNCVIVIHTILTESCKERMNIQIPLQQNKQRNRLKRNYYYYYFYIWWFKFHHHEPDKKVHFTVTKDIYVFILSNDIIGETYPACKFILVTDAIYDTKIEYAISS